MIQNFIYVSLCILLSSVYGLYKNSSSCNNIRVQGDVVYCIDGPICSSKNPYGECPKEGSLAVSGCKPGEKTYNSATKECDPLPFDSICSLLERDTYGCVLPYNPKTLVLNATFQPKFSGGAKGRIQASYNDHKNPLKANIQSSIDLTGLNVEAIKQRYPNCSFTSMKFLLHMHVRWNNSESSGFLDDCNAERTGGHYDPTFSCGPASQYVKNTICTLQNKTYACNPTSFNSSSISCEMGDFSGKFGEFIADKKKVIRSTNQDVFFPPHSQYNQPMYLENNVEWNFILHLSCPESNNPRILCAKANLYNV